MDTRMKIIEKVRGFPEMREIIGINPYDTQQLAFELEVEVNQPEQQLIKSKFEGQLTQKYSLNKPDVTFKMKEEKLSKQEALFTLRQECNLEKRNSKTQERSYISSNIL